MRAQSASPAPGSAAARSSRSLMKARFSSLIAEKLRLHTGLSAGSGVSAAQPPQAYW